MNQPLTLENGEGCCQWCYRQRTVVIALGSALGLCLAFVGAVFMAHFADHTPGWSLLIVATCVVFGLLIFLVVMNVILCICPQCVRDFPEEENQTNKAKIPGDSVFIDDSHRVSLSARDSELPDDFEL